MLQALIWMNLKPMGRTTSVRVVLAGMAVLAVAVAVGEAVAEAGISPTPWDGMKEEMGRGGMEEEMGRGGVGVEEELEARGQFT